MVGGSHGESGSRFAETNRTYQIDHKIPEKLFKNERIVRFNFLNAIKTGKNTFDFARRTHDSSPSSCSTRA